MELGDKSIFFFKMKSFFLKASFLFSCFIYSHLYSEEINKYLSQVSQDDLEDIRKLFNFFVYKTHFTYTLFSEKPITLIAYAPIEAPKIRFSKKLSLSPIQTKDNRLEAKWITWKKYQSLLPIKNYLFIEETSRSNTNVKYILFINKKHFINIVNKHQELFEKELNAYVDGIDLLTKIEQTGKFWHAIHDNELLLGILLGYGQHNATLYRERENLQHLYNCLKYLLTKKAEFIKDLDKQAEWITDQLQPFDEETHPFISIPPVQFVADLNSTETKKLKRKYTKSREKISKVYTQEDALEISLSALIQN